MKYQLDSKVMMKKMHPCGTNLWKVVRLGVDIKLECLCCHRVVMLDRLKFEKQLKKVVEE